MIIAIAIYVLAHVGVLSAPPVVINALAVGSVLESTVIATKSSKTTCDEINP